MTGLWEPDPLQERPDPRTSVGNGNFPLHQSTVTPRGCVCSRWTATASVSGSTHLDVSEKLLHQGQEMFSLSLSFEINTATEAAGLCLAPRKERSKDNMFPIPPHDAGLGGGGRDLSSVLEKSHCLEADPTAGDTGYFLPKAVNRGRPLRPQVRSFPQC